MTMKRTKFNIRTIAVTGMLGALATVLMFLEFSNSNVDTTIYQVLTFQNFQHYWQHMRWDRYLELQYALSRMRSIFFIHRQVESENYLTLS